MDINDVRLTKQARNTFIKHNIDISLATVRVTYGLCEIKGKLKKYPKTDVKNVEQESKKVCDILRKIGGIKSVVMDCTFDEDHFKK